MAGRTGQPLRVLLFSSGNPDGTALAAGLLHGRPRDIGAVLVQNVATATLAPTVVQTLVEVGLDPRGWTPELVATLPPPAVEVGITICVPTCDT